MNTNVHMSRYGITGNIIRKDGTLNLNRLQTIHINQLINNNLPELQAIAGTYKWQCEDVTKYNHVKGVGLKISRHFIIRATDERGQTFIDAQGKSAAEAFRNWYTAQVMVRNSGLSF